MRDRTQISCRYSRSRGSVMRVCFDTRPTWATFSLLAYATAFVCGCSQTEYRLQADREAYATIAERNDDPRWAADRFDIDLDPRSRYFEPYDPDHSPMPLDDPASHRYMHVVDDLEGWEYWDENGVRPELENPAWREALSEYVETGKDGSVKLDIESALSLAYVHSPNHQRQLETLYQSSLDVSEERFNLDTRFFGGYGTAFDHKGSLAGNSSKLTVGRFGTGEGSAFFARRRFATAGDLLVGFANSFVFEFSGGDTNLSQSLVNFTLTQPLLRGAGRDIALEGLTSDERKLLANLRAYGQFRQGFYTDIAIGDLGVVGPSRGQTSTNLTSFGGSGGVNGYAGLLQQVQQIRNTQDNLKLQERTLERLVALYDNELIDIVQVDQFRQSIEVTRANLLDQTNNLKLALDNYKTQKLGLPSDLGVELDESLIAQFQLLPLAVNPILDSLFELQARVGDVAGLLDLAVRVAQLQSDVVLLPGNIDVEEVDRVFRDSLTLVEGIQGRSAMLPTDVTAFEALGDSTDPPVAETEKAFARLVREKLDEGPKNLELYLTEAAARLKRLSDELTGETREALVNENVEWLGELLRLSQGCIVVQTRTHRVDREPTKLLEDAFSFVDPVSQLFDDAREDLARMDAAVPVREQTMTETAKELFHLDRERLHQRMNDLENGEVGFDVNVAKLQSLKDGLADDTRLKTVRGLVAWVQAYLQVVGRLSLVPAQARLEVITVDSIDLQPEAAFEVALANRLDFMNGRAALVDRWRQIQVTSDALQSNLTVTSSGDINTARDNPASLRAAKGNFRMGLQFDAPLTRLVERNAYRSSLITYQQSRREFIQSRDSLQKGLRALIRTLEQRRRQLEIQRVAVSIAIRRVDQTQLSLNTPPPQLPPGARAQINPTTAINLLSAQSSLQNSQNAFLAAWLNYYAARLRLYRELGVMQLDEDGRWIELPLDGLNDAFPVDGEGDDGLPPMVPPALYEAARQSESDAEEDADSAETKTPGLLANVLDRLGLRKIPTSRPDRNVEQVAAESLTPSRPQSTTTRPATNEKPPAEPRLLNTSPSSQPMKTQSAAESANSDETRTPNAASKRSRSRRRRERQKAPKQVGSSESDGEFKSPITGSRQGVGRKGSKVNKDSRQSKGWVATKPEK
jgi:outer membrane protein TolC